MSRLTKLASLGVALTALVGASFASPGKDLEPGDPAPAISVKTWYKGAPINTLSPDKTYVVEFWATWCGPCKQSIPHLTELAKKNPDVDFIGVSIWEKDQDDNISKFVQQEGDQMDYHVGYSGDQDGMAQTWMAAASQNGIPSAFIIKDGKIQWVGHPMELEIPLQQVKAGTFDIEKFKPEFDKRVAQAKKSMELNRELGDITKEYSNGDHAGAKAKLQSFVAANPDEQDAADSIQFGWLAKEHPAAWDQKVLALSKSADPKDHRMLLSFALRQTQPGGNLDQGHRALSVALKAAAGKDIITLEYANAFYKQTKETQAELDVVNQILALLPNSPLKNNAEFLASMQKTKADLDQQVTKRNQ